MRYIEVLDFFQLSEEENIIAVVRNISTTATQDGNLSGEDIAVTIYGGDWLLSNPGLNHTKTYSVVDTVLLNGRPWAEPGDPIGLVIVEND